MHLFTEVMEEHRAAENQDLRTVFKVAIRVVKLNEAVLNALVTQVFLRGAFVDFGVESRTTVGIHAATGNQVHHHLIDGASNGFHQGNLALLVELDLLRLEHCSAQRGRNFDLTGRRQLRPRALFGQKVIAFKALDFEGKVAVDDFGAQCLGVFVKALHVGGIGYGHGVLKRLVIDDPTLGIHDRQIGPFFRLRTQASPRH